jgi:signal transduction histidine kinase
VQLRSLERSISIIRLAAVPIVVLLVALASYPAGYEVWAWVTTCALAVGGIVLFVLARSDLAERRPFVLNLAAQAFDTGIAAAFVLTFSFARGVPIQQILYLVLAAACVRFEIVGGLVVAAVSIPIVVGFQKLRTDFLGTPSSWDFVFWQIGLEVLMALIMGWLVHLLASEARRTSARAEEAEALRDELRRRADFIDAANRCGRALGSSLELSEAFGAFLRELRGLLPFERVAIVLAEGGSARVMAAAGSGSDRIFPPGSRLPLEGSLLEDLLTSYRPVYRPTLDGSEYPEEREFLELGLGSRLAAPLLAGSRTIGMLSLVRAASNAFSDFEIELAALLGRLAGNATQNIQAYESEHRTVEELRRLAELRADFVSLVSHELRTPMAAVIGAARTLRQHWSTLAPARREALFAVIDSETSRLGGLIADVLDTSRIDSGTFTYSFGDIDVGVLVDQMVAALTQEDDHRQTKLVARVEETLPRVRGDADRLRQVLANLIENAVRHSPDGQEVEVRATAARDSVLVDVTDRGRGIRPEDRARIFEKFGRAGGQPSSSGAGLGLYIARSIAEAHGGSLDVTCVPGGRTTFTLQLPVERSVVRALA